MGRKGTCSTGSPTREVGGKLLTVVLSAALSTMLYGAMFCIPVFAQNPCEGIGSDCRPLTAAEVNAFKERILAVKTLLPVPDAARYVPDGAIEASSMPFIAETKLPSRVIVGRSWQAGCFPMDPNNTLSFGYDAKAAQKKPAEKGDDPAAIQGMMSVMENKIEVVVWLRPHAHLVDVEGGKAVDVRDQDAYNVEKTGDFVTWQTGEENVTLHMIFGPRTVKEAETLNTDTPARTLAPVKSIELVIGGPKDEVTLLKKRIDRTAMAGLLGPVAK